MTRLLVALLAALSAMALAAAWSQGAATAPSERGARDGFQEHAGQAPAARRPTRTCRGERASLVGRPGRTLRGTRGRDVVVTNGADYVDARRGADLVCVTGGRETQVQAGGGADTVVVRQRRGSVWTVLGAGPDTYRGGRVRETVYAARTDTRTGDHHRDVIRTRGGKDTVVVGRPGTRNRDAVRLGGDDDDELWWYSTDNRGARLEGGGGTDRFTFMADRGPDPRAQWTVDAGRGTISDRGTTTTRFDGFEDYYLASLTGDSMHFAGSEDAESVALAHDTTVSAAMAGGDDTVIVYHFASTPLRTAGPGLDGGRGRDRVALPELAGSVTADLAVQRISVALPDAGPSYDVPLASIEDLSLSSYESVTITGDDGPNDLAGYSCSTRISGAGGDDLLRATGYAEDLECARRVVQLFGDDGDDTLVGGRFDDLLDGGAGVDSADGAAGTDTCLAETSVRCEG